MSHAKILPAIRKQLRPLSKSLPPVGSHVLILERNDLEGDGWIVAEVVASCYRTEKRKTFRNGASTVTVASQTRVSRASWPDVSLSTGERVTAGKYLILAL